ncbi:hypothetical protein KE336_gp05 [Aeromonas phage 4_D05]|uniref:Uncharacterized protein n=1 Tax=Aeromonas phage 4_D05 TaxID=2588099 RepID=A0A514TUA2_9CAUD|nr:hypothetical protein KE336_gp05 [Aeromonas phage 4_D05]QDJ96118.1 hypothetical protein 4D05_005 [Aeromonas phage 4_D05]
MPTLAQGGFPKGLYSGTRAETVQFYDEANKKNGSQWTASRRLTGFAAGAKSYSILKTRTLPLDLKQRVFSYTGSGLIARFYTGFTPQTLPSPENVYCLRPGKPAFRDFDLYALAAAPASLGSRWSADIFLDGNTQVQGQGATQVAGGYGWIIDPMQEVLMEIESTDTQPQTISATLAMYNGFLDLPLPKMP